MGAIVTSIDPTNIGEGGGTIVIHGEGFATDAFSQFDPSKGNKVRGRKGKGSIELITISPGHFLK